MPYTMIVATASCRITTDVRENGAQIRKLMAEACTAGARLVHFPEGALSGYVKQQVEDWRTVDWTALRAECEAIASLAGQLGLWTVFGCNHRLTPPNRPHNSLYIISAEGILVDRYDKRLCSHTEISDWYTPGHLPLVFDVDGFKFGTTLCIEVHFPELFAEYERLGVDCILFSAYSDDPMFGIEAQAHAAINNFWLSLATPAQCGGGLASGLIGPDGKYISQLPPDGRVGNVYGKIDRDEPIYSIPLTKARPWRALVKRGDPYRAHYVDDVRSRERASFSVP
jgi:predicted amidohydrolase